MTRKTLGALIGALGVTGVAVAGAQVPVPTPSPTATAPGSAAPGASAGPVTPAPSPSPLPTPLVLPPDAPPQILGYAMNSTDLHSGQTISGTVITSTNVASVEIRIAVISINMPRPDFGVFTVSYQVPSLPPPMFLRRGAYTMQIIARNTAGVATELDVPVTVH